jgi:hypothetical protein
VVWRGPFVTRVSAPRWGFGYRGFVWGVAGGRPPAARVTPIDDIGSDPAGSTPAVPSGPFGEAEG